MCRSIKVLRRPGVATTPDELHGAALQFVRKISGFQKPSKMNQEAFDRAVAEIADSSRQLLESIASAGGHRPLSHNSNLEPDVPRT
ncbi:MAG TPA: DUF2277 domain-containing protein [Bryobacteraceae bacterium]|jgi:hypothetical protein